MVNIRDLIDDAKCSQTVRDMRWPDLVTCPRCSSESVITHGRGDTHAHRRRYTCHGCRKRLDDLAGTIFAGRHQRLRTWIICLDSMGLDLSTLQIAEELDMDRNDVQAMV